VGRRARRRRVSRESPRRGASLAARLVDEDGAVVRERRGEKDAPRQAAAEGYRAGRAHRGALDRAGGEADDDGVGGAGAAERRREWGTSPSPRRQHSWRRRKKSEPKGRQREELWRTSVVFGVFVVVLSRRGPAAADAEARERRARRARGERREDWREDVPGRCALHTGPHTTASAW
jgi:hypothetical protein